MSRATLFYVHDPMCSWCWAFDDARRALFERLPDGIDVQRLLGGLAPDSDQPMPVAMRDYIQHTWRAIENQLPSVRFNYDFWERCQPRRSTYPACRAVIAAREQGACYDEAMSRAIQLAYYRQARNPSDESTLLQLAVEIGLDAQRFASSLRDPQTQQQLRSEVELARRLQVTSLPGLVLARDGCNRSAPIDYHSAESMLEVITGLPDDVR